MFLSTKGSVFLSGEDDFLGHADAKTTEIYARANLEMKRKALEKVADDAPLSTIPFWKQDETLLEWLHSL